MLRAIALSLVFWCALIGHVFAQSPIKTFPPGVFQNRAALDPAPTLAYQGPGDVVGSATIWGSCARVYTASLASTSTNLCDLVAVTGGAAVCTLRGSSTGYVDLAASYCAGTTPSAACAAASGGSCRVTKIYDQVGSNNWVQATLGNMPGLVFSSLNGLPGINCGAVAAAVLSTGSNVSASQPFTFSAVYKATNSSGGGIMGGAGATDSSLAAGNSTVGLAVISAPTIAASATFGSYYAVQAVSATGVNGSTVTVDGTDTVGTYASTLSAAAHRVCRQGSGGSSLVGTVMEVGLWTTTGFNSTQRGNMNTNQHSLTSGYNF